MEGSGLGCPRMVRHDHALVDVYARQLLVRCDGDLARLRGLVGQCRREARRSWSPFKAWSVIRARRAGPLRSSWPGALSALAPWEMFAGYQVWRMASAIAQTAAVKVVEA